MLRKVKKTIVFLNLSVFTNGNSQSCALGLNVRFSLLGKSSLNAFFSLFKIFIHNFLTSKIKSLKSSLFDTYPFRITRLSLSHL